MKQDTKAKLQRNESLTSLRKPNAQLVLPDLSWSVTDGIENTEENEEGDEVDEEDEEEETDDGLVDSSEEEGIEGDAGGRKKHILKKQIRYTGPSYV